MQEKSLVDVAREACAACDAGDAAGFHHAVESAGRVVRSAGGGAAFDKADGEKAVAALQACQSRVNDRAHRQMVASPEPPGPDVVPSDVWNTGLNFIASLVNWIAGRRNPAPTPPATGS